MQDEGISMTACRHHDPDEECADCTEEPKTVPEWVAELREILHRNDAA